MDLVSNVFDGVKAMFQDELLLNLRVLKSLDLIVFTSRKMSRNLRPPMLSILLIL